MADTGLLIIGPPRSGSTLLASMVGAHPEMAVTIEDMGHGARFVSGFEVWGNKLCVPNQIQLQPSPSRRGVMTRLADAARAFLGKPRSRSIIRDWDPHFYDEPPHRQITIETYMENWDCHLLAILRSPDQCINSQLTRGSQIQDFPDPEYEAKRRWSVAVKSTVGARSRWTGRTNIVTYEQLVREPEKTLHRACDGLPVSYNSEMLSGYSDTPQYDHDGIDPSRAEYEGPSYRLEEFDEEAYGLWIQLK